MSERGVIVVTGATGRVGRQVAERLLSTGHRVRAIARTAENLAPLRARGAEVRAGALADRAFLTSAFRGSAAAFVLTPVDFAARDVNAEQKTNVESIAAAVRDAGVKYVVFLGSWGAELTENSGGIIGCHLLEGLLDAIPNLNVVHLRPVWFMENFLLGIPLIRMSGIQGLAIEPGVAFPTIATRDIAPVAADYLATLDFKGHNLRYLSGPRDYTMTEVARILGASIGKPELRYIQFPAGIFKRGLVGKGGLSPNAADLLIETSQNINSGRLKAEPRSASNTTPTTLETFAHSTFGPAFANTPAASRWDRFSGLFLRSLLFMSGHHAT